MTMTTRPLSYGHPRAAQNPSPKPIAEGPPRNAASRRLARACADFEAIFVEQLFKSMRASVPVSELLNGGRAEAIYTGMLDQQVATEMARGQSSIGLARQMQGLLARGTGPEPDGGEGDG